MDMLAWLNILFLFQVPIKFLPEFKSPCWFNAERQLRCLPYFLLIGAPKAGTSDVYTMLQAHPDFRSIHYVVTPTIKMTIFR